MAAGFGMEGNDIRPRFGKGNNQIVHRLHHQVNVYRHRSIRFQRGAHHGAESQIGHIMIVHHIEMNQIRPGLDNTADFLAQSGKIGR